MELSAKAANVQDILPWRDMYRLEMGCQIIHDSLHSRKGWTEPYLLIAGGVAVGYGSIAVGGPWKGKPTVFEWYVVPQYRSQMFDLFSVLLARRHMWLALLWAGCIVTHPLLDAMTDGGSGVMLLFPLSQARVFFPWRPIHVSPLDISRFFDRAGYILGSEWPFCLAALAIGLCGRCTLVVSRRLSD